MHPRDWPLAWKLLGGIGVVLSVAALVIFALLRGSTFERQVVQRLVGQDVAGLGLVLNADRDVYQAAFALHRAASAEAVAGVEAASADYADNIASIRERLQRYSAIPGLQQERQTLVDAALASLETIELSGGEIVTLVATGTAADRAVARTKLPELEQGVESFHTAVDELEGSHAESAELLGAEAIRSGALSQRLAFGGLVLLLILGAALVRLLVRHLTVPIARAADAAERLARGDLTIAQLPVSGEDEIGRMAAAFNAMVADLREMIARVQAESEELASSSREISSTVAETADAVTQLNLSIDQINSGAQEQAVAAQETVAVMGSMSGAIQVVFENARAGASAASGTLATARHGGETVQDAIGGLEEIRDAVSDAEERVRELGSHSSQIGAMVQVISDIARQTNLLALNAAIEAARAGEHGRGFAVVADEVRKLAARSDEAAREIVPLVTRIQSGTERAVQAMAAGNANVEQRAGTARSAAQALSEILEAVESTNVQLQRIVESAEQMAGGVDRVSSLVEDVAAVAQESAAAAQEMAAQSSQVEGAIHAIAFASAEADGNRASTQSLSATAERLQGLISRFRV